MSDDPSDDDRAPKRSIIDMYGDDNSAEPRPKKRRRVESKSDDDESNLPPTATLPPTVTLPPPPFPPMPTLTNPNITNTTIFTNRQNTQHTMTSQESQASQQIQQRIRNMGGEMNVLLQSINGIHRPAWTARKALVFSTIENPNVNDMFGNLQIEANTQNMQDIIELFLTAISLKVAAKGCEGLARQSSDDFTYRATLLETQPYFANAPMVTIGNLLQTFIVTLSTTTNPNINQTTTDILTEMSNLCNLQCREYIINFYKLMLT